MKRAAAFAVALLLAVPLPVHGITNVVRDRCVALTRAVNAYRVDLVRLNALCEVGARRAYAMARAGRTWHDLRPVNAALLGTCWTNVGEVLAWNNHSPTAFAAQWKESPPHWSLLMNRRYDRGGGAWTGYRGRYYAAYYVLDTC